MLPNFNSHLQNPNNQLQNNGLNASAPQQVIGNQGHFLPNPMQQIRPQFQLGMLNNNPQLAMPPPFTSPNPYFVPNQFFPFPQGSLQNPNANNLPQFFTHNAGNLPQFLPNGQINNQPQFLPNGQINLANLVQNVSQLLQMQMANCGPQNPVPFVNTQSGLVNGNGFVQRSVDGNDSEHINHNASVNKEFASPQAQRNQNVFSPGADKSQSNVGVVNGANDRNNSWRKSHNKNINWNNKHDPSQRGFGKNQFNHRKNSQGTFKFNNKNRGKGNKNTGVNFSDSCEQVQKRSLVLNYTEQEIRQWREERRKNHPSNANMKKKLKENPTQREATDTVAKIRRQQLKEILAKQIELGCEVAEIPSCYLSDSEIQTDGRPQNNKAFGKRERFHNKFDKRGKFHQNDRFSKRQRSDTANSQNQSDRFTQKQRLANNTNMRGDNKREPSLLKKLLSSDIKRDRKHLLQVFRFMVMNSFLENGDEKPLKFPVVIVKESGDESEIVKGDASYGLASTTVECSTGFLGDVNAASCSRAYAAVEEGEIPQEVGEIMG